MYDVRELLGSRIRFLRKELKLSQEGLALKAGLDRTYVASIENGKRNVSIVNIERIAFALNCSLFDLFNSDEFKRSSSTDKLGKVADKNSKYYN